MVKVVYFNQWFSSAAWIMQDLKKRNKDEIKIIASSRNENHVYKGYVDEFIVEDWVETENHEESMKNYVDFVLSLCKKYHVDYFFVKKHASAIMERENEFFFSGTYLISEKIDTLRALENKSEVYSKLKKDHRIIDYIPEYLNTKSLKLAVLYLKNHRGNNDLCLKFNCDEGGASFRAIVDEEITQDSLYRFRVNQLTTDEAIQLAVNMDSVDRLIIMEKLDSPEISVDCYNSKNGFIAICREKQAGRVERIYYNKEIADICKIIGDGLLFPFNVQFRYKANSKHTLDNLRLLEINTRMSGGTYYEIAQGLSIPDACLKDCMNREHEYNIEDFLNFEDKFVTHLELPILLN